MTPKYRLILLTGMPGSGKEEFVKIAMRKGIRVLRMGDFVRAETRSRGLELTDQIVGSIAQQMREQQGFDIWAKKTVEALDDRLTLVDGVRGRAEVALFRKRVKGGIVTVAIHASPDHRFERILERARTDSPKSQADFEQRELRELKWGLGDIIARADYMIVNDGSLEEVEKSSEVVIDEIVKAAGQ